MAASSRESEGIGRGAVFTLELPLRAVQLGMEEEVFALSGGESRAVRPPSSLTGINVLVVDDEATRAHCFAQDFEQCGARVTTASNN